jgi:TPP-dependent indolepyruvate ferredoxin oxidoreductase alpha subunit
MPVIIDYNLCDGIEGCPSIRICDAEALYFDPVSHRVEYDKAKCRDCGTCSNYCGMGAVLHAATEEEWNELRGLMESQ